jgi:bacillithiol system protein YtxJ
MSLQNRMFELRTPEDVDSFVTQYPTAAIFKAGTCHKTMQGWGNIEKLLREREDVPVGIIRVVEARPASNYVEQRTGITHQSPQIILFREGQAKFDLDNWNITEENLEPRFEAYLPVVEGEGVAKTGAKSNLEPYKKLLDGFIAGQVSEPQCQWTYLEMFRADASLRSQEEFDVLNSLFGNPDEHHIHAGAIMNLEAQMQQEQVIAPLLERAQELRTALNAL